MFGNIMQSITNALCSYGVWTAGLFSMHGMHEEKVPAALVKLIQKEKA